MKRTPIEATALLAQPLPVDANGNSRHFVPAKHIPVAPGSTLARKAGLRKYQGRDRGPGFVIQSSHLTTTLHEIFAALDRCAPEGAPHAIRSDGPLCVPVALNGKQYDYFIGACEIFTPSVIDQSEKITVISIPTALPALEREKAITMVMTFPVLRAATVQRIELDTPSQFYGLELLIRRDEDAKHEVRFESGVTHDHSLIASFLSRKEPRPR